MACPFLREGRARYCHAAAVRKLILDGPGSMPGGLCTTSRYGECALAMEHDVPEDRCPHLEEIHVQYCGASPVAKMVPFSEANGSRCTSGGFRYCDTYLGIARPRRAAEPPELLYAPNHLWLDLEEGGQCHIGVDAFFAEVAGEVDDVTFVTTHGTHRPSVALTVKGVEWPVIFPNPVLIQGVNTRLKTDPSRLTSDPYGSGWLFEGWELPGRTPAGLVRAPQATVWTAEERERLARHINESEQLGADGGYAVRGVARLLPRAGVVRLFQQFFSKNTWAGEE